MSGKLSLQLLDSLTEEYLNWQHERQEVYMRLGPDLNAACALSAHMFYREVLIAQPGSSRLVRTSGTVSSVEIWHLRCP